MSSSKGQDTAPTDLRSITPTDAKQTQSGNEQTQKTTKRFGGLTSQTETRVTARRAKTMPAGTPIKDEIDIPTDLEPPRPDEIGEYTQELSDFTDEYDEFINYSKKTGRFRRWYRSVRPLIKHKRIRCIVFTNFAFFLLNLILLIAFSIVLIITIVYAIQTYDGLNQHKPCLYEFTEWSKCSDECTRDNVINYKTRTVKPESIVMPRGKFAVLSPCPPNLKSLVDKAPCNTHACAKKLSEFPFPPGGKNCWAIDPADRNSKCYQIRQIPPSDQEITIDVMSLTQECVCQDYSHENTSSTPAVTS